MDMLGQTRAPQKGSWNEKKRFADSDEPKLKRRRAVFMICFTRNPPRGAAGAAGLGEAHRRLQDARWAALLTPSARCAQAA